MRMRSCAKDCWPRRVLEKRKLMEDVPRIVTAECRARAYLTPTMDRTGPIRTGRRATTLPGTIPRAVAANNPPSNVQSQHTDSSLLQWTAHRDRSLRRPSYWLRRVGALTD